MHSKRGKLIVFEGIDGCGKDTQIELLKRYLSYINKDATEISNISQGPLGKVVRLMLGPMHDELYINNIQVACVFIAELSIVIEDIKKLLDQGIYVICSRYYFSTLAYVGETKEEFNAIAGICKFDLEPDVLIYLDLTPEIAIERIHLREGDRECYEDLDKLKKIYTRYNQALACVKPQTLLLRINAAQTPSEVRRDIVIELNSNDIV